MLFPKSCIENTEELKEKACVYPVLNSATDRHCYLCFKKGLYLTKYTRDFMDILLNCKRAVARSCAPAVLITDLYQPAWTLQKQGRRLMRYNEDSCLEWMSHLFSAAVKTQIP